MGDLQDRMRQQFEQQQQAAEPQRQQTNTTKKADKSDYLDFEEIK